MAKKDSKGADKDKKGRYSDYPISTLRLVSLAAGVITFVVSYINSDDLVSAIFHSFVVIVGFSIIGALVMITFVSIMTRMHEERSEEMKRRLEEEQREFFESQVRLHEAMEDIGREQQGSEDADAQDKGSRVN